MVVLMYKVYGSYTIVLTQIVFLANHSILPLRTSNYHSLRDSTVNTGNQTTIFANSLRHGLGLFHLLSEDSQSLCFVSTLLLQLLLTLLSLSSTYHTHSTK